MNIIAEFKFKVKSLAHQKTHNSRHQSQQYFSNQFCELMNYTIDWTEVT